MDSSQISFGVAFLAGLASFLSPCVLPLVPIYLAQLVGHSVYQATKGQEEFPHRLNTFIHSLMFVLGFTLAFVALGATASTLGSFLRTYQLLLRQIGGVILVIFGLHLTGILKLSIFYWQKHVDFRTSRPPLPGIAVGRHYFRYWMDALRWSHSRSYTGYGGKCVDTATGCLIVTFLFARVRHTIFAHGFGVGSTQQSAQMAQASSGQNRNWYRHSHDCGGSHHFLQPASLPQSFL